MCFTNILQDMRNLIKLCIFQKSFSVFVRFWISLVAQNREKIYFEVILFIEIYV